MPDKKHLIPFVLLSLTILVAFLYSTLEQVGPGDYPKDAIHHNKSDMHHAGTMEHHAHQHAEPKEAQLITDISRGGYILYVRHERTELDRTADDEPLNFSDCSTQRELSSAGRESAKENAIALKTLGIPVSASYSSPFCRALETAEILFGKTEPVMSLSGRKSPTDAFDMMKAGVYTKDFLLSLKAPSDSNIAVTGHWGTINAATGIHVHEGDIAVFTVRDGQLVHHGNIVASTWSDVIHDNERARVMMHTMNSSHTEATQ